MTRSGAPSSFIAFHSLLAGHCLGGVMSLRSPGGAPASTHATIVPICSSVSDMSFLKFRTPTVLSMCHGGICRAQSLSVLFDRYGRLILQVAKKILHGN